MRLPAYPLITIDPFFSIWANGDTLSQCYTILWCGKKMRIVGTVTIDGAEYRFMGKKHYGNCATQASCEVTPLTTTYSFSLPQAQLTVKFWSPFFLDDITLASTPVAFVDYELRITDGAPHDVDISLALNRETCHSHPGKVVTQINSERNYTLGKMGKAKQKPLKESGDGVGADWGYVLLCSGQVKDGGCKSAGLVSLQQSKGEREIFTARDIIAYDDIYSIEYMGEKLKGLWTERFSSIESAIAYCYDNADQLQKRAREWDERLLADAAPYGADYQSIITAAFRQVLAAHKAVRSSNGKLLYMSKECHSNGCINTVDVTYPAVPLFYKYNPEMVQGMLNGIFRFASLPVWSFDSAPHDIGQYPIANGQVYGLSGEGKRVRRTVFEQSSGERLFNKGSIMPVEECGNMLILAYTYARISKDYAILSENYALLNKWANYLKNAGIELENQICTDDFMGKSEKNVNLAVKSCIALRCFHETCILLGKSAETDYGKLAADYAQKLVELALQDGYLNFSIGNIDTWSLKYNMAWDVILGFKLFPQSLYEGESKLYREQLLTYGVPLDSRGTVAKSDWLIWASALDASGENLRLFSHALSEFLRHTPTRMAFSDCYYADSGDRWIFDHRSVQGGLWMPMMYDLFNRV